MVVAGQLGGFGGPPSTPLPKRTSPSGNPQTKKTPQGYDIPMSYSETQDAGARSAATTGQSTGSNWSLDSEGNAAYSNVAPGDSMADRLALSGDATTQQKSIDQERAGLQADAEHRRQMELAGMFESTGGGPGGPVARVNPAASFGNEQAARDAAFARAKDQVGHTTEAALKSLRDVYSGTGMVGAEHGAMTEAVGAGAGRLGDTTREQLITDLNRAADIGDETYAGELDQRGQDINMRGQDIASKQALMGLITARGLY